jgi:hypothetical protein
MYYTIVTIIAVVLLVLVLTIMGIMMTTNKNKKQFPEFKNTCPDYWSLSDNPEEMKCVPPLKNNINIPSADKFEGANPKVNHDGVEVDKTKKITSIDISKSMWTNDCDKQKWAKNNNILWDGITNINTC